MTYEPHEHGCIHGEIDEGPSRSARDEIIDEGRRGTPATRRSILAGLGALGAFGALGAASARAVNAGTSAVTGADIDARPVSMSRGSSSGAELVLLGTRAGPPVIATQTGIASALVVNGATYVVDCGRASVTQFVRAGLPFASIKAMFLTHLHADHVADYYNFFLLGNRPVPTGDCISKRLPVYGPGPAGGLQQAFGGAKVGIVAPDEPTPGTARMTELLHRAYAYSSNVFMRDMLGVDPTTLTDVREIELPEGVDATYLHTSPRMSPFRIYEDENVTVTATLVPHGMMYPSYAFRFDTEYGSVTFSGDTAKSENLAELAHRTDILVHEAIGVEGANLTPAKLDHHLESHTLITDVGGQAQKAEARSLVLSHINDLATMVLDRKKWQALGQQGYTLGTTTCGVELQRIPLRKG